MLQLAVLRWPLQNRTRDRVAGLHLESSDARNLLQAHRLLTFLDLLPSLLEDLLLSSLLPRKTVRRRSSGASAEASSLSTALLLPLLTMISLLAVASRRSLSLKSLRRRERRRRRMLMLRFLDSVRQPQPLLLHPMVVAAALVRFLLLESRGPAIQTIHPRPMRTASGSMLNQKTSLPQV